MWKTELGYGLYGGLAICVYKYIEYLRLFQTIRLESGIYTGLFTYVIVISVILLGVRAKRSIDEYKLLSFRQALMTGLIMTIVMTVITIPFMYIQSKYINSNEADEMIKFIAANPLSDKPPTAEEIYSYYSPRHRSLRIGEDVLITGLLISLFTAGMFRRAPADLDLAKKPALPSTLKKVFLLSTFLTVFTLLVYVAYFLNKAGITSYFYDFLVDPISERILQAITAMLALASLTLNIAYYNRLSHYRRRHNIWNVMMMIICGTLFFVFLWTIF